MSITYVQGDATYPIGTGRKIIIHVCNDIGGWGSGFVLALSKRWSEPELKYRELTNNVKANGNLLTLGTVQFVEVGDGITVGNMIGQHMTHWIDGMPPVRYHAIGQALDSVARFALARGATIHAPRFGAGLAGGNWKLIENLIEKHICSKDIPVTIYDFPQVESFSDEIERRKGEAELFKDLM